MFSKHLLGLFEPLFVLGAPTVWLRGDGPLGFGQLAVATDQGQHLASGYRIIQSAEILQCPE